ncbi:MAG: hypothetical protein QM723_28875 [Myxococcaceae bacterium]
MPLDWNQTLVPGDGFTLGHGEVRAGALVKVDCPPGERHPAVQLLDSKLQLRRILCPHQGDSVGVDVIAAHGGAVFFADQQGLKRVSVDGGEPELLLPTPQLEVPHAPASLKMAWFWLLTVSGDGERLAGLCGKGIGPMHLLEVEVRERRLLRDTALTMRCDGIAADFERRRVVLPGAPAVVSFEGVSTPLPQKFRRAAVRARDGAVALTDGSALHLWDGATLGWLTMGDAPCWSAGGETLYFMRGPAELWARSGSTDRLICRATGHDPSLEQDNSGVTRPRISPDGRFLLAGLAVRREPAEEQAGVVIDLEAKTLWPVPGFSAHCLTWL